jgi:hypothetical protein
VVVAKLCAAIGEGLDIGHSRFAAKRGKVCEAGIVDHNHHDIGTQIVRACTARHDDK